MPRLRRSRMRRYWLHAPRLLRRGLLILIILLCFDGIITLCSPQIQAALSIHTLAHTQKHNDLATLPALAPMNNVHTLAEDSFKRGNQTYWGVSTGGQTWMADANKTANFTISHDTGIVSAASSRVYAAVLGPKMADTEITFSAMLSDYQPSVVGAVLRWQNPDNFYEVVLDGEYLALKRVVDRVEIPLQTIPFVAGNNIAYTFRFRAVGTQLSAMVWPTGQSPLVNWQLSFTDSSLEAGYGGLCVFAHSKTQAKILEFKEVAL